MNGMYYRKSNHTRTVILIAVGALLLIGLTLLFFKSGSKPKVLSGQNITESYGTTTVMPWDYKVEETKVGDLIGADMVVTPDNQLLPNDSNYATGDKVFVLSYMSAEIAAESSGKTNTQLSAWRPIKSFKTKDEAQKDLDNLKKQISAEVDLVGVYKTELNGQTRQFAVVKLPTGQNVKQPISPERYASMKDKKQVKVLLEEVHDFVEYDNAMSKFRGWID